MLTDEAPSAGKGRCPSDTFTSKKGCSKGNYLFRHTGS